MQCTYATETLLHSAIGTSAGVQIPHTVEIDEQIDKYSAQITDTQKITTSIHPIHSPLAHLFSPRLISPCISTYFSQEQERGTPKKQNSTIPPF